MRSHSPDDGSQGVLGARVLHVDDDPSVLDLTAAFLERELADPRLARAESAAAGIEAVESNDFECIISDYEMPRMDGLAFFEAVRDRDPEVPFVLYTGKGSEEIASRALNAGVTGYFQKGGSDQQRRLANRVEQAVADYRTRLEADRYSTVLEALEYPIYVVDETGRFEYVNEPLLEMTGYDREAVVGSETSLIKDEAAVLEAEQRLATILSSEGPDTLQFPVEIVSKSGERIPCRDHMAALPYEGERFRGSVGILRNISDERQRQQDLAVRTRALEEAPIGIALTDFTRENNPMVYVNDSYAAMTGHDREELLGENPRMLQGPATDEARVREFRRAIDAGEPTTVELRNYRKDGSMFWNRVTIAPITNEAGEITNWVGFQEDVTEQKEAERSLQRQNDRLDRFASVVSHDLRSPMSVADGHVELAREECDSDHLDRVETALDRMDAIIEDALTLARQGETVTDTSAVELSTLAAESWRTVETGGMRLETPVSQTIRADASRLRSLLENLFRNAIEHADGATTVRVGPLEDGFYVEDDGPGIPEEDRDHLFEPGFTTDEDGTGFGLAIVLEIVTAHGWAMTVTDGDDGARFEITGVERAE
jgi:PAS domain S-box-containing protein